jgi:hypothetical protein
MDSQINGNPRRSRKLAGWILFMACLLLLSLGATPYHKVADSALIAIRLSLVFILSALVIRERWNPRRDVPGGRASLTIPAKASCSECGAGITTTSCRRCEVGLKVQT